MISYNRALEIIRCENIETTLRTRRLLWAETLIKMMSNRRLPKRIIFGNIENSVGRERGRREKGWIDCIQGDVRAFCIAGE